MLLNVQAHDDICDNWVVDNSNPLGWETKFFWTMSLSLKKFLIFRIVARNLEKPPIDVTCSNGITILMTDIFKGGGQRNPQKLKEGHSPLLFLKFTSIIKLVENIKWDRKVQLLEIQTLNARSILERRLQETLCQRLEHLESWWTISWLGKRYFTFKNSPPVLFSPVFCVCVLLNQLNKHLCDIFSAFSKANSRS